MPLLKILRVTMPTVLELVARIVATAFSLAKKGFVRRAPRSVEGKR